VLIERGKLGDGQRVADACPEFPAHGKDRVTLDDVLRHACGRRSHPRISATVTASAPSSPTSRHGRSLAAHPRAPRSEVDYVVGSSRSVDEAAR
jgi:hypothetical protein